MTGVQTCALPIWDSSPFGVMRTRVRITPKGEESRLICESRLNDYITGIMDDLGEEFCQQFAKDAETLLQAIERQNEKLLAEKEKMP